MEKHNRKWFSDRIGKTIYRTQGIGNCLCKECQQAREFGIVVMDEFHAGYLYDIQSEADFEYTDQKPDAWGRHELPWFESRIGRTVYPSYAKGTKDENPTTTAKHEKLGIELKHHVQAKLLFDSQGLVGTRYSDERKEAV